MPEALDRVVMKALAREPDERYQDAAEMQRGLERVLRERPPVTARDLARFMELLFDRDEREEAIPRTCSRTAPARPSPRDGRRRPEDPAARPAGRPRPARRSSMSVDALLRRFGIE